MDETLVVFNELLNGKFAAAHPNLARAKRRRTLQSTDIGLLSLSQDAKLCEQVAQGLESAIFHICDHHFFFRALEVGQSLKS